MKLNVLALALAATAFGTLAANAQTTTIVEERRDPAVVIESEKTDKSVTIEKRGPLGLQKKSTTVETTGSGQCSSKTVHREGVVGSSTTKSTTCD